MLYWDGKDDFGKPAPAGCKVRVLLGLKPEFERILLGEKPGLRGPISAACAPDGTLYVADITELGNISVRAFDREGRYLRTVLPFPANMKAERLKGLPMWKTDAGLLPIRELDQRLGWTARMADTLADNRQAGKVRHEILSILRQRLFGLIAGYEDANDHTRLRHDPLLKAVAGGDLAEAHHKCETPLYLPRRNPPIACGFA